MAPPASIMGHPEYAVPVYTTILVLLLVWLLIPWLFVILLLIKVHLSNRERQWLEAENEEVRSLLSDGQLEAYYGTV